MSQNTLAFFIDLEPAIEDFRESVVAGLSRSPRELACKFFYDPTGMELFHKICNTDEYYVTRTELALLRQIGPEVAALAGPDTAVVEFGAGSDLKVRLLLDALERPAQYVPIDIAREPLRDATEAIARDYPAMRVGAICADFTTLAALPEEAMRDVKGRRLGFFPGSTIGNFTRSDAADFMALIRSVMGPGGALLIGVDLKKDEARLNAAYNDAAGYTAAFNLNLLHRMKRELGAELDPDAFEHVAFYNDAEGRVEMHLRSLKAQTIRIGSDSFDLAAGEQVHSENSHKYGIEEFTAVAQRAGFESAAVWTDPDNLFSIHYLTIPG